MKQFVRGARRLDHIFSTAVKGLSHGVRVSEAVGSPLTARREIMPKLMLRGKDSPKTVRIKPVSGTVGGPAATVYYVLRIM